MKRLTGIPPIALAAVLTIGIVWHLWGSLTALGFMTGALGAGFVYERLSEPQRPEDELARQDRRAQR